MPRAGGIYAPPPGTDGVPNTPIESAKYNAFVADITADQNGARPPTAGGTGGTSAVSGNDGLNTTSTDMASAATLNLANATGVVVNVTGTTTITALGTVGSGALRVLVFADALTLTHNATSLILPGAANITTAAGDAAVFRSKGSGNWVCVGYQRAVGMPATLNGTETFTNKTLTSPTINGGTITNITDLAIADGGTGASTAAAAFANLKQAASETATGVVELATAAEVATGTDTGRVPSVSTMGDHQGVAKAWVNFNGTGVVAIRNSFNVSSITDEGTGRYTVNFGSAMPNANYAVVGCARRPDTDDNIMMVLRNSGTYSTSAVQITTRNTSNVDTKVDADIVTVVVFGD